MCKLCSEPCVSRQWFLSLGQRLCVFSVPRREPGQHWNFCYVKCQREWLQEAPQGKQPQVHGLNPLRFPAPLVLGAAEEALPPCMWLCISGGRWQPLNFTKHRKTKKNPPEILLPMPGKALQLLLAPRMLWGSSPAAASQHKLCILERQINVPSLQLQGLQVEVWTHKSKVNVAGFACWSADCRGSNPATCPQAPGGGLARQRHQSCTHGF